MKLIIRYGLFAIALICFSNMGFAQNKKKNKAKTTISTKKKKKSTNKKSTKKSTTIAKYIIADTNNLSTPIKSLPIQKMRLDSIPEKVVTIISAFKPQLKNVAKIGFMNATAIVDTSSIILTYQVPSQNLSFQYQPIALVPRAIKIDSINKVRQSAHLKIGLGNYFNQFFQFEGSTVDQKSQQHHISVLNESIAGEHPIQKWNTIGINYIGDISINKNQQINTQVYFNQSNRYRYGLVPDSTNLPLKNFEQKLILFGANFALINKQVGSKSFRYDPIVKLHHSQLLDQANNLFINLNSPLLYKLNPTISIHSDVNLSYNQYKPNNKTTTQNTIIQFNPSFEIINATYRLNFGVSPIIANGDFALYPNIGMTKQLKDTNFVLNAGWNTSLINHQLIQLMGQNHWIGAPNNLPISSIGKIYFNVHATVNKRLNYAINMALNDYSELPFFNQSKQMNNPIQEGLKFEVLFEKRAIAIELNGNLRYQISDKLLWKNHLKYIQFNLIRENTQAWGILPIEFNTQLNWIFNKKIQFDASGQFWTGAKTSAGLGNAYRLNNTFVINAGMQYTISDHWTFWGKGENLLDQYYQRWANYPSLGVQIIAGIQYKFRK